jgi:hypothetical protein
VFLDVPDRVLYNSYFNGFNIRQNKTFETICPILCSDINGVGINKNIFITIGQ